MLRQLNSLTVRLIGVALLGAGLVVFLSLIGWGSIIRLIAIGDAISVAEGQENRLLSLQTLIHNAVEIEDEQAAYLAQIQLLIADFDETQAELRQRYEPAADDPRIAQVLTTIDDTSNHWNGTSALLENFSSAPDSDQIESLSASLANTNVYANRTSEAFQAVAERERQNVLVAGTIVGLLSIVAGVVVASLIFDVVRDMRGLTQAASALSEGKYTVRANTRGLNEVAAVSRTFNQMAESIQQREVDLREANETLEQRVRERTIELEKATAEAREASRAKDEFLSVMSHELRTPLNAILGYQGILELVGGLEDDNLDMVQRTAANARRLLGLINDVLDISRIEAGRMEIVPSRVVIRDFVQQIQSQIEVLAAEKNIQFVSEVDENMPPVIRIDEDALSKIIVNLAGNGIKFTPEGQVSLTLRAQENKTFQIIVRDTGIGIPAHMQQIIFERFRQADSSTTRNYGGSGLGLSIVQQLCALMGGTVIVDSAVGEGSTFTVTLALEVAEPERVRG